MANPSLLEEQQIQTDVEHLRSQFPQTRDLYREVCAILFFRYGITPTANKLYHYVKKGSMSAPAEALSRFWLELREKSRVRLEHPDLPENIQAAAGELVASLWTQMQEAAEKNYSAQNLEAQDKIRQSETRVSEIDMQLTRTRAELSNSIKILEITSKALEESEKKHAVDMSALAALEKSLLSLQNERDQLQRGLEQAHIGFSKDLDKLNVALSKTEDRYRALEARSLMEIERERHHAFKSEKIITLLSKELRDVQQRHQKELMKLNKVVSESRELIGELNGKLSMSRARQKIVEKEVRVLTFKLQKDERKRAIQSKTIPHI